MSQPLFEQYLQRCAANEAIVCGNPACAVTCGSLFRVLADHSPHVIWLAGAKGERLFVNRRWREATGYAEGRGLDRDWETLIHPEDRAAVIDGFQRALTEHAPWRAEYRLERGDGSYVRVVENATPFFTQDRLFAGFLGTLTDPERERRLLEQQRDLTEAQRIAGFGNWFWDIPSDRLTWSDAVYDYFGVTRDGVVPSYELFCRNIHPDDLAMVQQAVQLALRGEEPYHVEHRIVRPGGEIRYLVENGEVYFDESGAPLRMIGTVRDITARRLAEQRLRESEEALRTIFDGSYDAILIHDVDGRILDVNRQMLELYRVTAAEARELSIGGDYSSPRSDLSLLPGYWARVMRGETVVFEWLARRPHDGHEFDVEVVLRKIVLGNREVIIANVRDCSERKRLEQRLMLASRVLENSIEGITVTNAEGIIEMVNPAFTAITGFTAEEALGQNPRILKSEHHRREFYEGMWQSLVCEGHWSGEIWNRRKNGEAYPEWLSISAIYDAREVPTHYVGIFHDITEIKKTQERLHHQAYHDALTGLPNRTLFVDRLEMALHHAVRHDLKVAVLFLDLDQFKNVNDSLGHAAGDELLREVAGRLRRMTRDEDSVCRLGGDEFTLILTEIGGPEDVAQIGERVLAEIGRPYRLRDHDIFVGVSIGISVYPHDGGDVETLIKNADMAMYRAKEKGRNNYQFFTRTLSERALSRIQLEAELRYGVERREFVPYFQPKIELATLRMTGMEALVRWRRADGRVVGPDRFIPLAEETGLIIPLGEQVLEATCAQMRQWLDACLPPMVVAVNLSPRQFWRGDLPERILDCVKRHGLEPSSLELEVTESLLMKNVDKATATLRSLKSMGFRIALDDFGTGYSSLYYLKRFPIDALKIDRSFVMDIPRDRDDMAIAEAIVSLARSMNLTVIAEGVESTEQLDFLKSLGCHYVQGYLFSKPLPAPTMTQRLSGNHDFDR